MTGLAPTLDTRHPFPPVPRYSRIPIDRKSTRLNSSHSQISYAVFCLKKKKHDITSFSSAVADLSHVVRLVYVPGWHRGGLTWRLPILSCGTVAYIALIIAPVICAAAA